MLVATTIFCPHCGEPLEINVDTSQGSHETVEDCQVCCRPMRLIVACEPGDLLGIEVE
jgi:Cysteine-rich CPXCG